MRRQSRVLLFITVLMLSIACVSCTNTQTGSESETRGQAISREQAVLVIDKIIGNAEKADIKAYPELDQEIDGILYYFIRVIYENNMSAVYYVDAAAGNAFVAVNGKLDIGNPLVAADVSAGTSEAANGQASETRETATKIELGESIVGSLSKAIGMTEEQVREQFGKDYKDFTVSYDGYMKAYYYMKEGFIAAFGNDGAVKYVYCTDTIDVRGARTGMNFAEIQELLGNSPIRQTWADTPENAVYEITYDHGTVRLVFFSPQKDGSYSILRIG